MELKQDVSIYQKKLQKLIDEDLLCLAKKTGFHQRHSGKIDPQIFLDTILLLYKDHKEDSLEMLCHEINQKYGINISKQGLDQRFSEEAAAYIGEVLKRLLEVQLSTPLSINPCLTNFTKIKIKDSTTFRGFSKNIDSYKGFDGCGTASCFQVQLEFDLKTGKIEDLELTSGNSSDQIDARGKLEQIARGELIIRDLGYVSQFLMNNINHQGAYYLNKIRRNVLVFNHEKEQVTYKDVLKKMKQNSLTVWGRICLWRKKS